jgi:hypothetical protein
MRACRRGTLGPERDRDLGAIHLIAKMSVGSRSYVSPRGVRRLDVDERGDDAHAISRAGCFAVEDRRDLPRRSPAQPWSRS